MTNGTATADLIGVRAAARALKINPSTLSRYLKSHPGLDRGTVGQPMVGLEELRRHRAENVNPAVRGRKARKVLAEGGAPPVAAAEAPPAATKAPDGPNYAMAKAVRETVLAQRARVDLDEKRGLLVPRREIEDAVFEAGLLLQRNLLHLCSQVAERLASMSDARQITELLEAEHRKVLAQVAAALRAKAGSLQAEDKARDATD
ncbi:MAG: hypothetical protein IID48_22065 [Proteobacteria bacterium]|nr:hypothetical protein [Pseudomonadota bacterium]